MCKEGEGLGGQPLRTVELSGSIATPGQDADSLHGSRRGASGLLVPLTGCCRVGDGVQVPRPKRFHTLSC